jgi:respiratory burst oxidase
MKDPSGTKTTTTSASTKPPPPKSTTKTTTATTSTTTKTPANNTTGGTISTGSTNAAASTLASKPGGEESSSWWARSEAYYFNHGTHLACFTLSMALNCGMGAWGVWQFTEPKFVTEQDTLRITLPIARLGGRLVTWNIAVLLLTACKFGWTLLRTHTTLSHGFPMDAVMPQYHKWIAYTIIVSGCIVHTIPQVINYATKALVLLEEPFVIWTFGDGRLATNQLLYTGCLLFLIFSTFCITTLTRVRHTAFGFRIFWWCHVVGIVMALPLLIVHGTMLGNPILLYFIAIPLVLYLMDVLARRWYYAIHGAKVVECTACHTDPTDRDGDKVTKLVLQSDSFRYSPGQYAEVKIPLLSQYEWHPFTIASAYNEQDKGQVTFFIKAAGKWTNRLFEVVDAAAQEAGKETQNDTKAAVQAALGQVSLRGPYGAPAQNYMAYQHIMVIGSGIGVTPLLSIWQHLVHTIHTNTTTTTPKAVPKTKRTKAAEVPFRNSSSYYAVPDESEQDLLQRVSQGFAINSIDIVTLQQGKSFYHRGKGAVQNFITFSGKCAYVAAILESMTVNMTLFSTSVSVETLVFILWLFKKNQAASLLQALISLVALSIFGSKIVLSVGAYGVTRYFSSSVAALEVSILLLDGIALLMSVANVFSPSKGFAVAYFSFFAAFMILHGVRIFHIFYATARPPVLLLDDSAAGTDHAIQSVTGIWVGRTHAGMSFAARDLLETLYDDLSPIFSLQFYGTREKKGATVYHKHYDNEDDNVVDRKGRHTIRVGRPSWHEIFHEAIEDVHCCTQLPTGGVAAGPNASSIGVFFCGSPAIARDLQRSAQQITAHHQHRVQQETGIACHCRILVHKENF